MPKVIKKRVSKRTAATEEDVKERLSSLKDIIKKRQKIVLKYIVAIIAVFIAGSLIFVYSYASKQKAKKLEYEAYKIYYSKDRSHFGNKEEQYKKAMETFKKAYDSKKSPRTLLYIAACYYELGQYDDALKTLKDFTQRYSDEDRFMPLAYQKMAMVYMKRGDTTEAMKTLDILYNLKVDIFKDFALMEQGRLLEKEGKAEEAKKKYEELTTRFPESPFIEEAKEKLIEKKEG